MNNKGFAITTILYGTLILFLMLLLSMLGILNTYKDRLSMLIDSNNGARAIINGTYGKICGDINGDDLVNNDDYDYLLMYVMFGEDGYPISNYVKRNADFDDNGKIDTNDAVYLQLHIMFGEDGYPIVCR